MSHCRGRWRWSSRSTSRPRRWDASSRKLQPAPGRPLSVVVGDVALASPQRPSLFIDASPERAPWVSEADIREKGAILVWPLSDAAGMPPVHIRARFPDLVPEVPRAFERPVQGRLPLLQIGWAMIRPQASARAQ